MTTVDADRLLELSDADPETIYALYEQHGWGDGLPLVPPTPERVAKVQSAIDSLKQAGG